jgi:predicted dehydrogenase
MTDSFNWGILATGAISNAFAEALSVVEDATLLAVASRTQAKADDFAAHWDVPRSYGSYDDLLRDPDVDIVYIGTPHAFHHENMLACLHADKHVLCEKPLTLNAAQASECIALAREKNLFLMEAMWTRFFPAIDQVRAWLAEGRIGDIRLLQADFCMKMAFDPEGRLYNLALGGGALLDLGVYPLSLASMLLGLPDFDRVTSHAFLGETGVDELDSMTLVYDEAIAMLGCSFQTHKPREAFIAGTEGFIKIHDIFFKPDRVTLHPNDDDAETLHLPYTGNGYPHEIEEVHRCLREGRRESAIMPLDESIAIMQLMDDLRRQWGVVYPQERQ